MSDLKSKRWIVMKGILFLIIVASSAALIWMEAPTMKVAALLGLLIWAACRFYYFLFYVLEKYVDPTMKYAGIVDLLRGMKQRRERMRADSG